MIVWIEPDQATGDHCIYGLEGQHPRGPWKRRASLQDISIPAKWSGRSGALGRTPPFLSHATTHASMEDVAFARCVSGNLKVGGMPIYFRPWVGKNDERGYPWGWKLAVIRGFVASDIAQVKKFTKSLRTASWHVFLWYYILFLACFPFRTSKPVFRKTDTVKSLMKKDTPDVCNAIQEWGWTIYA